MELFNYSENCKEFSIFFLGDVHEGNANHNEIAFEESG